MAEPKPRVTAMSEDPVATERRISLTPTLSERPRARAFEETLVSRPVSNPAPHLRQLAAKDPNDYLQALNLGVTAEHAGRYGSVESARELGRGGLGRVFVALDQHLGREVAVKELLPEVMEGTHGSEPLQAISRFLREARVTGQLDHPNIVPVYELGRRADGRLYYTMRVVRGRTLARAIVEAPTLVERLALMPHFSGLCQAIAYAHSRGVVHRDIKPENVMVGDFGETVVLDWGMAKLRGSDAWDDVESAELPPRLNEAAAVDLTLEGTLCGTPVYMSPEQAQGRAGEVDERSDVWSLGVVLYTLLAGRPPFSGKTFPSILEKVVAGKFAALRDVDPSIPPELAAVVERALRTDKRERYASARELSRDVQAYQAGARVGAYEYSSLELVRRFLSRHRAAVVASAVGLSAVLVLGAVSYGRVVVERNRALAAERRAIDNERAAKHSERAAQHSLGEMLLEKAEQALSDGNVIAAELLAARALRIEEHSSARGIVLAAQSSLRPEPELVLEGARGCGRSAFRFDTGELACGRERTLELWDARERRRSWALPPFASEIVAVALGPRAGSVLVALSDGMVRLYRAPENQPSFERRVADATTVALSADGLRIAVGTRAGSALVFDVGASAYASTQIGQAVSTLAFTPNGASVAVAGELGAVAVWEVTSGKRRDFEGHDGTVRALDFAQEGRYLASAGVDRAIRFWDTEAGHQLSAPVVHTDAVTSMVWSEDARFLVYGSKDKSFSIRDLRARARQTTVRRHDDAVELVAMSSDVAELASFSRDAGLELWSLASRTPYELAERGNILSIAFVPGEPLLVSAGLGQNGACLFDLESGACSTRLPVRLNRVRALAVSNDGRRLALAGSERQIFLWDLTRRVPSQVLEGQRDEARAVAFSNDGAWLAAGGLDRSIRLYDAERGTLTRELPAKAALQSLSFTPSSELLSGDRDGALTLWDTRHGRVVARWKAHEDWVLSAVVAPGGHWFASSGGDRKIRIWDAGTRKLLRELAGHEGKVLSLDVSADGALLASSGEDKRVHVWDAQSGRDLARLTGHEGPVRAVRFARSGKLLASGSDDGTIRLWRLDDLRRSGDALTAEVEQRFGVQLAGSRVVPRR